MRPTATRVESLFIWFPFAPIWSSRRERQAKYVRSFANPAPHAEVAKHGKGFLSQKNGGKKIRNPNNADKMDYWISGLMDGSSLGVWEFGSSRVAIVHA